MKQSSFGGIPPFKSYQDSSSFRQSEILQRQHEIMSRQVDSFPFHNLPENVIKPTFVKEGTRRVKLKSSSQGSPASNSHTSDGEKTPELEENNGSDKQGDDSSMDVSSTPTTPLARDYRARSEASAGMSDCLARHCPYLPLLIIKYVQKNLGITNFLECTIHLEFAVCNFEYMKLKC